jgi:Predicted deacylase
MTNLSPKPGTPQTDDKAWVGALGAAAAAAVTYFTTGELPPAEDVETWALTLAYAGIFAGLTYLGVYKWPNREKPPKDE